MNGSTMTVGDDAGRQHGDEHVVAHLALGHVAQDQDESDDEAGGGQAPSGVSTMGSAANSQLTRTMAAT
jgi:hypothetical protein